MDTYKKIVIYFFLYVFCSFIITPAVIKMMEAGTDVSCFYNIMEEEHKGANTCELKELKELPYSKDTFFYFSQLLENKANYYYHLQHYDSVIDIVIPPPEHIV